MNKLIPDPFGMNKHQPDVSYDGLTSLPDLPITETKVIDRIVRMTGVIQLSEMIVEDGSSIYFISRILNGYRPQGEYFANKGRAILEFELMKKKLI